MIAELPGMKICLTPGGTVHLHTRTSQLLLTGQGSCGPVGIFHKDVAHWQGSDPASPGPCALSVGADRGKNWNAAVHGPAAAH